MVGQGHARVGVLIGAAAAGGQAGCGVPADGVEVAEQVGFGAAVGEGDFEQGFVFQDRSGSWLGDPAPRCPAGPSA